MNNDFVNYYLLYSSTRKQHIVMNYRVRVVLATYIADKMVIQFQNENSDIIQMGDESMNYLDHVRWH